MTTRWKRQVCTSIFLIGGFGTVGCEKQTAAPPEEKTPPPVAETKPPAAFSPPVTQLAVPAKLLALRLKEDVGTITRSGVTTKLAGFGVNRCQTGHVLQAQVRDGASLKIAATIHLPFATLPLSGTHIDPETPESTAQRATWSFSELSESHVVGKVAIESTDGEAILGLDLNGPLNDLIPKVGLGSQGCFTTGYYRLNRNVEGPVHAVYDGKSYFHVSVLLSPTHQINLMFDLRPKLVSPSNVLRGDLKRIFDAPEKFPFRVTFETRTTKDGVVVRTETPAKHGQLVANFKTRSPKGPLKLKIIDFEFPEWDGVWSDESTELELQTLFVTEHGTSVVPIPDRPQWQK